MPNPHQGRDEVPGTHERGMVTKPAPAPQFKTLLGLKSAVWWFMAINRRMRNTGNLGALSSMHSVLTGSNRRLTRTGPVHRGQSSSHRQLLTSTPFTVLLRSALPTFASVPTGKVTCFRVADLHGCNSGASPLLHDTAQSTIIVDFLPPAMQSVPDPVGITSDHPDQVSIIVVFPVAHGTGIGHSINRSADSEREDLRAREHLAFIKSSVLITWLTDSDPSMVAGGGFKINGAAHG
ncbi:hypothetical protein CIRG_01097 [Coccidioides immitis RMSCC 2394]|uniref:Uncharacterized protein n=1 Tax=Coccidioides immitis RMSCC 2394 TaxID=404692 RepID=A0A0J7AUG1_COCIT|nr:hypothetical protein CIRG_01097 [Coccidioides immitis RMSCC 2394]